MGREAQQPQSPSRTDIERAITLYLHRGDIKPPGRTFNSGDPQQDFVLDVYLVGIIKTFVDHYHIADDEPLAIFDRILSSLGAANAERRDHYALIMRHANRGAVKKIFGFATTSVIDYIAHRETLVKHDSQVPSCLSKDDVRELQALRTTPESDREFLERFSDLAQTQPVPADPSPRVTETTPGPTQDSGDATQPEPYIPTDSPRRSQSAHQRASAISSDRPRQDFRLPPLKPAEPPEGFWSKLWHGHYGLAKTYWLFFVLGGAAGALLSQVLLAVLTDHGELQWYFLVLLVFLIYEFVVLVGLWRAASRYRGPKVFAILTYIVCCIGWFYELGGAAVIFLFLAKL